MAGSQHPAGAIRLLTGSPVGVGDSPRMLPAQQAPPASLFGQGVFFPIQSNRTPGPDNFFSIKASRGPPALAGRRAMGSLSPEAQQLTACIHSCACPCVCVLHRTA